MDQVYFFAELHGGLIGRVLDTNGNKLFSVAKVGLKPLGCSITH